MNSSIRKFIFHDLQAIEGYIDPPDALVFLAVLRSQQSASLQGGLAEIGVYYGRSYFLLRKICGETEKIVAVDPFDIVNPDHGATQYERFLAGGRQLGLSVDAECVIKSDSTLIRPGDIIERAGMVRFFSIDGGHMLHHVEADSHLAAASLAEHGIIVFDDTFNPAWPEVTAGVTDFLRAEAGRFSVFCLTKYKTYVCRQTFHEFYSHTVKTSPELKAFDHLETEFLGSTAIRLHNPMRRRIAYEVMVGLGMRALSERAYR
ncbi:MULTISPECIES: class I SAM-dependent methyltransferase [unclassified Rhizobium]|uniref:class I SAM-dependent methyltransferase n=1 Tax=unclassified Rhizobium TaxID=2613769 RepID=UPI001051C29C|nr:MULTISPECIES: class I SAM-dependent methyltransferase [unclassified Rhizobium]TCM72127.1 methyltransferase family protein [Rhizobium sp. BK068]